MRKTLGLLLISSCILLGLAWLYRLELATSVGVYLAPRFGFSSIDFVVTEIGADKVVLSGVRACYPLSGRVPCLFSKSVAIDYEVFLRDRTLEIRRVSIEDAEVEVQFESSAAGAAGVGPFPQLPLTGKLPEIAFRTSSSPKSSSGQGRYILSGLLNVAWDKTALELQSTDHLGRLLSLKGESSKAAPLLLTIGADGREVVAFSVSDVLWTAGTMKIMNVEKARSYLPALLIPEILVRAPSCQLAWEREKDISLDGKVTWKEPGFDRHGVTFRGEFRFDDLRARLDIAHENTGMPGILKLECANNCLDGIVRISGDTTNKAVTLAEFPLVEKIPLSVFGGNVSYDISRGWGTQHKPLTLSVASNSTTMVYRSRKMEAVTGRLRVLPLFKGVDEVLVGVVEGPIPVKNLRADTGLVSTNEGVGVQFSNVRGEVLGGNIMVKEITFGGSSASGVLTFHQIGLGHLLALHKQEYIEATGTISGEIPFTVSAEGFSVTKGTMFSDGEGTIRYIGDPVPNALGQAAAIADKALRNFRYSKITAEVLYEPSGNAHIKARLEGTSPLLNTDRSVIVNLALEENMLDLLRTLTISQEIEREVRNLW